MTTDVIYKDLFLFYFVISSSKGWTAFWVSHLWNAADGSMNCPLQNQEVQNVLSAFFPPSSANYQIPLQKHGVP